LILTRLYIYSPVKRTFSFFELYIFSYYLLYLRPPPF